MKNCLTGVTTPFSVVTPMKQIVINADDDTHAWIAEQAKNERRTNGNQALHLLGLIRASCTRTPRKPRAKAK